MAGTAEAMSLGSKMGMDPKVTDVSPCDRRFLPRLAQGKQRTGRLNTICHAADDDRPKYRVEERWNLRLK